MMLMIILSTAYSVANTVPCLCEHVLRYCFIILDEIKNLHLCFDFTTCSVRVCVFLCMFVGLNNDI